MRWRVVCLVCNGVLWCFFPSFVGMVNFFFLAYSFEIIVWSISSVLFRMVMRDRHDSV